MKNECIAETEPSWSIRKTERMLVVNFWVSVMVMVLCLATAVANWRMAGERAVLFSWVEKLQQRVIALEAAVKERQTVQPLPEAQTPPADRTKE
ncbi:MAG: hypothetical protein HY847_11000 [Betaproteobacteria bacterium]|nr:hypothetical protein [Betaproteobacteria bacterium]